MQKTNRAQTARIMLQTAAATLFYGLICIYQSRFRTRSDIDHTIRRWASHLLNFAKVSYQVFNPQKINCSSDRPYIIMSNHASLYDIPLIYAALPGSIRMIAKKELFRIPFWGYATRKAEMLSIDRGNPTQAKLDLAYAKEKMRSGIVLWMAPEGTRSRHGKLNPFKKGGFLLAMETGATIIPVGIRGSDQILPPGTWHFGLNQKVEIHIGEPIDSTQYTLATRNELIAAVRHSILKAADLESV